MGSRDPGQRTNLKGTEKWLQRAATDNQMKYINKLITDRGLTTEEVQKIIEHIGATSLDNLNIAQASDMRSTCSKNHGFASLHPEEFEEFDPDSLEPMDPERDRGNVRQ